MGTRVSRAADEPAGLSFEEVGKHNTKNDAWLVLFGEVIDVTRWLPLHPGGEESIETYLGQDATEAWVEIHTAETLERNLHHMTKMGKIARRPGLLSWLLERIGTARKTEASATPAPASAEAEAGQSVKWGPQHEALLPESGVFDLETLAKWDGEHLPMSLSAASWSA